MVNQLRMLIKNEQKTFFNKGLSVAEMLAEGTKCLCSQGLKQARYQRTKVEKYVEWLVFDNCLGKTCVSKIAKSCDVDLGLGSACDGRPI